MDTFPCWSILCWVYCFKSRDPVQSTYVTSFLRLQAGTALHLDTPSQHESLALSFIGYIGLASPVRPSAFRNRLARCLFVALPLLWLRLFELLLIWVFTTWFVIWLLFRFLWNCWDPNKYWKEENWYLRRAILGVLRSRLLFCSGLSCGRSKSLFRMV